jgi:hypothetical protein
MPTAAEKKAAAKAKAAAAAVKAKAKADAQEVENPQTISTLEECELHVGNVTVKLPKGYKFNLNEDETGYEADETSDIKIPLLSELEAEQVELFK